VLDAHETSARGPSFKFLVVLKRKVNMNRTLVSGHFLIFRPISAKKREGKLKLVPSG
jgi:hypothetical protein